MTREQQVERVRLALAPAPLAIPDEQGLRMWAERVVDALRPVEDEERLTRLQIANAAMQAARLAFDAAEFGEAQGIIDGLLGDVREGIDAFAAERTT